MPNSTARSCAILAAFCAILCALSGMGGGGMMIGARTAAWYLHEASLIYNLYSFGSYDEMGKGEKQLIGYFDTDVEFTNNSSTGTFVTYPPRPLKLVITDPYLLAMIEGGEIIFTSGNNSRVYRGVIAELNSQFYSKSKIDYSMPWMNFYYGPAMGQIDLWCLPIMEKISISLGLKN